MESEASFLKELRALNLPQRLKSIEKVQSVQERSIEEFKTLKTEAFERMQAALADMQGEGSYKREVKDLRERVDFMQSEMLKVIGFARAMDQEVPQLRKQVKACQDALADSGAKLERSPQAPPSRPHLVLDGEVRQLRGQMRTCEDAVRALQGKSDAIQASLKEINVQVKASATGIKEFPAPVEQHLLQEESSATLEVRLAGLQEGLNRMQDRYAALSRAATGEQESGTLAGTDSTNPVRLSEDLRSVQDILVSKLEAESTRRCAMLAELHAKIAREVATVSRHVELRCQEMSDRLDSQVYIPMQAYRDERSIPSENPDYPPDPDKEGYRSERSIPYGNPDAPHDPREDATQTGQSSEEPFGMGTLLGKAGSWF